MTNANPIPSSMETPLAPPDYRAMNALFHLQDNGTTLDPMDYNVVARDSTLPRTTGYSASNHTCAETYLYDHDTPTPHPTPPSLAITDAILLETDIITNATGIPKGIETLLECSANDPLRQPLRQQND